MGYQFGPKKFEITPQHERDVTVRTWDGAKVETSVQIAEDGSISFEVPHTGRYEIEIVSRDFGLSRRYPMSISDNSFDPTSETVATQRQVADAIAAAMTPEFIQGILAERSLSTGPGLTGGGTLDSDRQLSVVFGDEDGTAAVGNDPRFVQVHTSESAPDSPNKGDVWVKSAKTFDGRSWK